LFQLAQRVGVGAAERECLHVHLLDRKSRHRPPGSVADETGWSEDPPAELTSTADIVGR
jgi:hypothetical protein